MVVVLGAGEWEYTHTLGAVGDVFIWVFKSHKYEHRHFYSRIILHSGIIPGTGFLTSSYRRTDILKYTFSLATACFLSTLLKKEAVLFCNSDLFAICGESSCSSI